MTRDMRGICIECGFQVRGDTLDDLDESFTLHFENDGMIVTTLSIKKVKKQKEMFQNYNPLLTGLYSGNFIPHGPKNTTMLVP